jgi:outer membrane protein
MNMSSKWVGGLFLATLLASGAANAELKIGVVDFTRLQGDAPQARASLDALRTEFTPKQKEIETRGAAQKARIDRFQKDQATMSPDQRSKLEKEIRDEERELARRQSEFTDDFNARRNEELAKLNRILIDEVRTYARAQNYDLVLSGDSLAYATATVDITSAVLGALTARTTQQGAAGAVPVTPRAPGTATPPPAPRPQPPPRGN